MARVILFSEPGGPEVLYTDDVTLGDPGPGEARVRQYAAGLNFIDTYHRSGYYPVPGLPSPIGVEGAGVVASVGPGVSIVAPGDRVAYVSSSLGAYADERIMDADSLVRLPDGVSFASAAAMMLKGMTARYLLRETYAVQRGDTIVVHAAAGGVGSILVQWAHLLGATVIGTVGSREKADRVAALGCDRPVLYREESLSEVVREITGGEGVPVVYDSVGRDTFEESLKSLRIRGTLVSFGQSSGPVPPLEPRLLTQNGSLYLTRPSLFHYVTAREELEENTEELFAVTQQGTVSIPVNHTFPLEEAADAHRALEARETTGSTVLEIAAE